MVTGRQVSRGSLEHTESMTNSQTWWGMLLHLVLGFFLHVTTGTFSHFSFFTSLQIALGTCLQIVSVTTEQTSLDRVTQSVLGSCLQFFTGNFWHFSLGTSSQIWLSLHCLTGTSLHTVWDLCFALVNLGLATSWHSSTSSTQH